MNIIRFLLLLALGYILYKVLWKGESLRIFKPRRKQKESHPQTQLEEMKKDPVCGTYVPENQAIQYKSSGGEIYYFCSNDCHQKFRQLQEK